MGKIKKLFIGLIPGAEYLIPADLCAPKLRSTEISTIQNI